MLSKILVRNLPIKNVIQTQYKVICRFSDSNRKPQSTDKPTTKEVDKFSTDYNNDFPVTSVL